VRAALTILAVFLIGRTAMAAPSARLHYTRGGGAEACPDEAAMRRAVASQLGYDPFDDQASTSVEASILRKDDRLFGRVDVVRPHESSGKRELSSREVDCEHLASAMALTISMAIDPMVISRPPPAAAPLPPPVATPSPPPSAPPPFSPPAPPAPPSAPPPTGPRSVFFLAGLAPLVSVGIAPGAAVGIDASAAVRWPHVSLGIEGRVDLPSYAHLSVGGDVNTSIQIGMLAPCAHVDRIALCVLGAVGSMRGESTGITTTNSEYVLFAAAGARVAVEIPLSPHFLLRPELDGFAALARPSLHLNRAVIWTTPPFSASLGLAAVVRF
jgi:hypothetical protein